jgi:cytochrome c biogenesis protein CcmG/thiol:disulfide interchange protein DsbE
MTSIPGCATRWNRPLGENRKRKAKSGGTTYRGWADFLLTHDLTTNTIKINMNWIQRNWTAFSIFVLVIGAGWMVFLPALPNATTGGRIPAPGEGFLAPDFALQNTQGQIIRLSDLRGKPVLINLWASWCPPCQAEMPAMQKTYEIYAGQGFTILAVNTTYQDEKTAALAFVTQRGLTFPILFDLDGSVSRTYQVHSMPTSFFIDRQGVIRRVVIGGPMAAGLLQTEVEQLVKENR